MKPGRVVKLAAPAQVKAPDADAEHREADADHDAEAPEDQRRVRPVFPRPFLEALDRSVEFVGQDQAAEPGDLDGVIRRRGPHVGPAEQNQRRARAGLEVAFQRGDLGGLVVQRIEAVRVAGENLDRRDDGRHRHRHREHQPRGGVRMVADEMQRADGADDERGREVRGEHHVHEPVGEGRIENDLEPARHNVLALVIHRIALRGLHPAVDREDPERGHEGAERDHQRRHRMQRGADALAAKQHDAQEARLEKEGGENLIAHQRPEDGSNLVGINAPVGAELVAHHDARDDAHAERDGEDLLPVVEEIEIDAPSRDEVHPVKHGQVARKTDREHGEYDVEADREGELPPGEVKRCHRSRFLLKRVVGATRPQILHATANLARAHDSFVLPRDACRPAEIGRIRTRELMLLRAASTRRRTNLARHGDAPEEAFSP